MRAGFAREGPTAAARRHHGSVMLTFESSSSAGVMTSTLTDDLYAKLINEEDARVCREIRDEACRLSASLAPQ